MGAIVPSVVNLTVENNHRSGYIKVSLARYPMPVPCGLGSGSWDNALVLTVNVLVTSGPGQVVSGTACPSRRTGSRERDSRDEWIH